MAITLIVKTPQPKIRTKKVALSGQRYLGLTWKTLNTFLRSWSDSQVCPYSLTGHLASIKLKTSSYLGVNTERCPQHDGLELIILGWSLSIGFKWKNAVHKDHVSIHTWNSPSDQLQVVILLKNDLRSSVSKIQEQIFLNQLLSS